MNDKNIDIEKPDELKEIHDKIKQLLIDYNDKTGIAITYVSMNWLEEFGGKFAPIEIKIESKKY